MSVSKKTKKSQEKEDKKEKNPIQTTFRLQSTTYFLTYKGISHSGIKIDKNLLANFLLHQNLNDLKLKPIKYLICQEMYDSGEPHFHAILIYQKRKNITKSDYFDYLGIHPNIQTMRNMKAALNYVYKQDPDPITNMDIAQERRKARAKSSSSLYQLLEEQMKKDPFNFNIYNYCLEYDLAKQIYKANYTKALKLLCGIQEGYCNKLLYQRVGFKFIDRTLIQQTLSFEELKTYDSWSGYQTIVDHLNQIPHYRFRRPAKTMNLLITGPKSIGKSALVWQQYHEHPQNPLNLHVSVYPMGMKDWFPNYKSQIYDIIYWNEAKLTSYSYDTILQLLDGSPVMLPSKGGGHKKIDNPLVIMTSNMTLEQMIQQKFFYNKKYQDMAKQNMSVRITNVVVPPNYDLFLLQKLLIPN